ncbi:serine hydrolase [Pararhodobacter sp.]|uniref:serine hydrolase n=1 Tax=Pararhodobacter sp. TaxID=2127056 RepID=UPI002B001E09|nr:serine hydrolase [Pararhodobacter sp.]
MDVRTGEILRSSNATARLHPASLTKMMTLYIAFEAVENGEVSLDTRVRISQTAASQPPSRLGLRAGQTIAFRYLIRAAALRSANDAAVAIAEALEGSVPNFATRMNRTARAMGMTRTSFRNPHGLTEDGHLSTATDMSILGRQLYFDFPQYYNIFSRMSEDAGIATVRNTNRRFLSGYAGADGIKTGFTNAAGYNLTAMAERGGVRILVTVMGGRSSNHRYEQVVALMDTGFRQAPSRAAIRRPSRPNYVRAPEDSGTGVSAGRVIRLQTAPTQSRFPAPRPLRPGEAPSAELIAALRDEIDEVIEDIRAPEPDVAIAQIQDTTEEPEEMDETDVADVAEGPVEIAAAAPDRSPVPAPRPETEQASAADAAAELTELAEVSLEDGPEPVARLETPNSPLQFEHSAEAVAEVAVQEGEIAIPGLPPIAFDLTGASDATPTPGVEPVTDSQPVEMIASLPPAPMLAPAEGALAVGDDGRILWRDEELLTALEHEEPADPVLAPAIVLTSSGSSDEAPPPPMPEIVTRVSTSGGRVYAVSLGQYPSRFDAERVLLRLALSEAGTLGTGVRRVTPRAGRFTAEVHSLSQDDAALACARLTARNHACDVVEP